MNASGENDPHSPSLSADPATTAPQSSQSVTPQADNEQAPAQSNEGKRKPGEHSADCACLICERKRNKAEAQKKSDPSQQGQQPHPKQNGASSNSSSGKKNHLPSKSGRSTHSTMAAKVEAMRKEQAASKTSKATNEDGEHPQHAAERSMEQTPKQGGWYERLFSGWGTVLD